MIWICGEVWSWESTWAFYSRMELVYYNDESQNDLATVTRLYTSVASIDVEK